MAVTSIWPVTSNLSKVIRYVENPEKTETLDLYFDIEIAMAEFREKTRLKFVDDSKMSRLFRNDLF